MTSTLEPYPGDPAADADGARTPPGPRVIKVSTVPPGDRCARLQAMLQVLADAGLRGRPAILFLAHVSRETGYGSVVWNWNVGNVKAFHGEPWYRHGASAYVAFGSAVAGMAANVSLVRDQARYRDAWARLVVGDPNWYGELGRAGYYEVGAGHHAATVGAAQAEYDSILRTVGSCNLQSASARIPWTTGLRVALGFGLAATIGWLWKGAAAA